jgi:hypothetical protein
MSTTLLFVELLIAGTQVVIWFVLLILTIFDYKWISSFSAQGISDWQILVTATVLAFVYVLGILFDRLADLIFSKWDRSIAYKRFPNAPHTFAVIRFQLSKDNEYLNHQFEYTRSRLRIARASSLNFAITTIVALIFVATRLQGAQDYAKLLIFIALTGICLTSLAILTWYYLVRSYFGLIKANYMAQNDVAKVKPKKTMAISSEERRTEKRKAA